MALTSGSRFGPFEIDSLLGAGGMGEVYRARDTRLGREVALKVISAQFAGDADRLARFEREARALASLNHPGIAAIYGIEEIEGVRALVLELVEGETLEQRLRTQGRLAIDDALRIARQIADALDAAHDRGFVHRDLKPSNIALTRHGAVKLLDFGIAKTLFDPVHADAATIEGTEQGVILGTAAYMSPEQARGQAVNKRTDVWSFGCVLYEMLTGRAPFRGSTWSDTVSLTLTAEPDWTALPRSTPPGVLHLLKRCLRKDVNDRLRGLGDIELALEAPAVATAQRVPRAIALAVAAGIGLAIAGAVAMNALRREPAAPVEAPIRFEIPWSIQPSESGAFAISPDGKRLAFIGTGADGTLRMWERSLEAIETRPINGTEGEVALNSSMFWSPDSQSIGFYADGAIKRVDPDGGVPQVICRVPGVAVGGTWNDRGDVVVGTPTGLLRCAAEGGAPIPVTSMADKSGTMAHFFPTFLPDGRHALYLQISRADPSSNGLFVADLDVEPGRQSTTRVLETGFGAQYVAAQSDTGRILFSRAGALWSVPFRSDQLVVAGEATEIASPLGYFRDFATFYASATTLVYRSGVPDYQLTWRNRAGATLGVAGEPGQFLGFALSPDENRAVVARENRLNRSDQDLWLIDVRRNSTTRFTMDALPESIPTWSSGSDALFYASGHDGAAILRKALDGSAPQTVVVGAAAGEPRINPLLTTLRATSDGRFLTYSVDTRSSRRSDIWSLRLQGGGKPTPLVEQEFDQTDAAISPDGRWLAYVSNEAGGSQVFLRQITSEDAGLLRTMGSVTLVSPRGGHAPRWRADGQELFYLTSTGQVMAVAVAATIGAPRELFQVPGALSSWDVSKNGERFLFAVPARTSAPAPFSVILNWQSEPSK